jgi:chromate reductase
VYGGEAGTTIHYTGRLLARDRTLVIRCAVWIRRKVKRARAIWHPIKMHKVRLFAISGSLRGQSINTALLGALARVAPPAVEIVLWKDMDEIPAFNPDVEQAHEAGPVGRFRTNIREADAVVFSTPEYAHGIPGSLKNALDWVVGSGELSRKPVVLVNASARGIFAQAALKEVLSTMDACLMTDAELTIDLQGKKLTATEIAEQPIFASLLISFLQKIAGIQL